MNDQFNILILVDDLIISHLKLKNKEREIEREDND